MIALFSTQDTLLDLHYLSADYSHIQGSKHSFLMKHAELNCFCFMINKSRAVLGKKMIGVYSEDTLLPCLRSYLTSPLGHVTHFTNLQSPFYFYLPIIFAQSLLAVTGYSSAKVSAPKSQHHAKWLYVSPAFTI